MYYLQSRYYYPEVCRFINADRFLSTGTGFISNNMYSYCLNNPVAFVDSSGEFPWVIIFLVVCAVAGGVWGATSDEKLVSTPSINDPVLNSQQSNTNVLIDIANCQSKKNSNSCIENTSMNPEKNHCIKGYQTFTQDIHTSTSTPTPSTVTSVSSTQLTTGDRVVNTLVGAACGLGLGGLVVAGAGAAGVVAAGSAYSIIPAFGLAGGQTTAIGLLFYNLFGVTVSPFLEIEFEPVGLTP